MSDNLPDRPRPRPRPGRLRSSRAVHTATEGRVIGEYTLPHNGRVGRSDAMAFLLQAMDNHVGAADRFRRHLAQVLASPAGLDGADYTQLLTVESHAAFFRKLHRWGYGDNTSWDELAAFLPQLHAEAQAATVLHMNEESMADLVLAARQMRLKAGAEAFIRAADTAMSFLSDDDTDDS